MFIALMYFEWRSIFKCINRCKDRMCGKSSQRQIGFVEEPHKVDSDKEHSEGSEQEGSQEEGLDDSIN